MPFRADKSNVGPEMLRWSLFKAAREFGANEHTSGKKLGEAGELAGPDECFCSRQILKALYGELHAERPAKLAAERQQVELENAIMRGDYLSRTELERTFGENCAGDHRSDQGKRAKQGSASRYSEGDIKYPDCDQGRGRLSAKRAQQRHHSGEKNQAEEYDQKRTKSAGSGRVNRLRPRAGSTVHNCCVG